MRRVRSIPVRKWVAALVFGSILGQGCDSLQDVLPQAAHSALIIIKLAAECSDTEEATVSVDGAGAAVIRKTSFGSVNVYAGEHTVRASSKLIRGSWTETVTIAENEEKTVFLNCAGGTVLAKPGVQWALDYASLYVRGVDGAGVVFTGNVVPGFEASFNVNAGNDLVVAAYGPPPSNVVVKAAGADLFYGGTFTFSF